MKNFKKNVGGITLIALVITIIVLIILAAVSIATLTGENGILTKANDAGETTKDATEEEQVKIAVDGALTDGTGTLSTENVKKALKKEFGTDKVTDTTFTGDGPWTFKGERNTYTIETTGKITSRDLATPPTGGIESEKVASNLKEYQGKFVDIGLDVDGKEGTTNDWEIFYVNESRIFLVSADYVPTEKLKTWNVIGSGTLDTNGFKEGASNFPHVVYWPNYSTKLGFLDLPTEPDNFLGLVMHNGYNLETNKGHFGSKAASNLLNKDSWNAIKTASGKSDCIDFVIGGPTIEMWCAAWNKAVEGDTNGFVTIDPDPKTSGNGYGYNVKHDSTSNYTLYMNGTTSSLGDKLTALGTTYKTFFPHTESIQGCYGYWLSSPSAGADDALMVVNYSGDVNANYLYANYSAVRPLVCLQSGVQLVETSEGSNIYNVSK